MLLWNASEPLPPTAIVVRVVWRERVNISIPPGGRRSPIMFPTVSAVIAAAETILAIRASFMSPVAS